MDTLFRLIHVSDFHLGDVLYPQRTSSTTSGQITLTIHPLEIHDLAVLEALSNSVLNACQTSKSPTKIIVTGDLTTFGTSSALDLAFDYIRTHIHLGGTQQIGFNKSDAIIVPGNHDVWGSATISPISGITSVHSTRTEFDQRFDLPASLTSYPQSGSKFPHRLQICDSPLIYLYSLDSTRLDAVAGPQAYALLTDGFIDKQQLDDLNALVKDEPDVPRLRIAALHHALKHPKSGAITLPKGRLLNSDEVLLKLQQLGFALALCGHLHEGFSAPSNAPPYILAAGTSAQNVHLSRAEKKLLSTPGFLLNPADRRLRAQAMKRTNEYKIYEFMMDAQTSNLLTVVVHTYFYVPGLTAFEEKIAPTHIIL